LAALPTDDLLEHGNPRVVYGIRLAENFDVAFPRSEYNAMRWDQNRGRVPRYQPVHPRFGCRVSVLCRIVRL